MTISMPQKVAQSRGFDKQMCDLRDIEDLYEQAGSNGSWVESRTFPLVGAKLGS